MTETQIIAELQRIFAHQQKSAADLAKLKKIKATLKDILRQKKPCGMMQTEYYRGRRSVVDRLAKILES